MELTELGFDRWVEQRAAALLQPGDRLARVTAVDRGAFLVRHQDGERHAELAGKFRFAIQSAADLPCVGDWVGVRVQDADGPVIIHSVVPRRTHLRRKCPGRTVDYQMIDQAQGGQDVLRGVEDRIDPSGRAGVAGGC